MFDIIINIPKQIIENMTRWKLGCVECLMKNKTFTFNNIDSIFPLYQSCKETQLEEFSDYICQCFGIYRSNSFNKARALDNISLLDYYRVLWKSEICYLIRMT